MTPTSTTRAWCGRSISGPAKTTRLKRYFPDRKVWLMQPDAIPPLLTPYPASRGIFEDVQ